MSSERSTGKAEEHNVVFSTQGSRNAVLNWMRNPRGEFRLYGDAYHDAGKTLLEAVTRPHAGFDFDCVPIVFLYRQALELNLKSIIIRGNGLLRLHDEQEVAGEDIFRKHSLTLLFAAVEKIIEYMEWKEDYAKGCIENFDDCRRIVEDFNKIDPQSYAFRYPIDTKGKGSVSHHFAFDIRIFAARLDPLIELMSGTAMALDDIYERTAEAMAEAQEAARDAAAEYEHEAYNDGDYEPRD